MTQKDIVQTVRQRFAQLMGLDAQSLDFRARLVDSYGVDSMRALRLICELEAAIGCDIPEKEIQHIETLDDVVRLCHRYHTKGDNL